MNKMIVFLVGVGAPESLYKDYLNNLKNTFPNTKVEVIEWWNQDDFGISALESLMRHSEVVLISHSAGSVMALQALKRWPGTIKKIIMLDSHFLRTRNTLSTVERMLDIMFSEGDTALHHRVREAYEPLIENGAVFNKALKFAVEWVSNSFDEACALLKERAPHFALHLGFSNSSYEKLKTEEEQALCASWEKFNVDVKCLPMNHFGLIDTTQGARINQWILTWLNEWKVI